MKWNLKFAAGVLVAAGLIGGGMVPAPQPNVAAEPKTPDEKLLFGFEKDEAEKAAATIKSKGAFQVLKNGNFHLSPGYGGEDAWVHQGIRPMECVLGDASQGKYALKVPQSGYQWGKPYLYVNPVKNALDVALDPRANLRLPELFTTSRWFAGVFPEDWSGYDLLRVDVKVIHDRPVTILVEVEDDLVEPPVSQTYEGIKPDSWVTLELDLAKAAKERALNLKKICNFFVRFDGRKDLMELASPPRKPILERAAVYLDNIRLSPKDAACKTPVLRGERSSYTKELPRAYATEIVWDRRVDIDKAVRIARAAMPKPAKRPDATEKVTLSPPLVIDLPPLLKKGYVADKEDKLVTETNLHEFVVLKSVTAASPKALLVALCTPAIARSMPFDKTTPYKMSPLAAVTTTDGGKTWGGFKGAGESPTWLSKGRKMWEGTVFDGGADVMGLHDDGCLLFRTALEDYPGDRVFFWRTVYTEEGWKESPRTFVSGDPRWCGHASQNIVRLPSGRLWCMFSTRGRQGKGEVWAKYSDDEGVTWQSWRGPGLVGTVPLKGEGTAGAVRGELFPFGEHVGMIARRGQWTYFDGKTWVTPPAAPVKDPVQVVACDQDLYVIDQGGILVGYDGRTWKPLALPGREEYPRFYRTHKVDPGATEWVTQQYFSVCGDTVLFVEVDKTGKKLLCWRKPKGGAWAGPQELVSEETPIADVVAPRYGLPGFTPVAYNCWNDEKKQEERPRFGGYPRREIKPWAKVLKVPAQ